MTMTRFHDEHESFSADFSVARSLNQPTRLLFPPLGRKLQFPRSFVVKYSLHIRVIMPPVSLLTELTTPVIRFPLLLAEAREMPDLTSTRRSK